MTRPGHNFCLAKYAHDILNDDDSGKAESKTPMQMQPKLRTNERQTRTGEREHKQKTKSGNCY